MISCALKNTKSVFNRLQSKFENMALVLLLLVSWQISTAQVLEVFDTQDPPYTVENLITNVFLGDGVEITNIEFEGADDAVGYFQKASDDVGIERGIMITTGSAKTRNASIGADSPAGQNSDDDNGSNASDAQIEALATEQIFNLSKYEITFVPVADTLRFKYVFASEEYPEFTCAAFNDIFGFFISGPNPAGGNYDNENIAIVPGTNLPVAINSVHSTNPDDPSCQPINDQFYNDNTGNPNFVYDAYLDVFIAEAIVIPCEEYVIKLAIADQADAQYDSAVFLEAKSFGTGTIQVETVTVSADGSIVEGCSDAEVSFVLPYFAETNTSIDFNILGTAQNGTDYVTIQEGITIPAGSNSASIILSAIEDDTPEPIETIGIDIQRDICNRDTFWINVRDKVIIEPTLQDSITVCGGQDAALDATLNVNVPPPPQFRNDTPTIIHPVNTPIISSINVSGVAPFQLGPQTIKSVCIDSLVHPWIDDIDVFLISPSGLFIELTTDNGGNGGNGTGDDFYLQTCFTPTATQDIKFGNPIAAPPENVPFTGEFQPEGYFADLWDGNNPTNGTWQLQLIDDTPTAIGQLFSWSICFNNTYDIAYEWTPSAGLSCTDCPNPTANPSATTTYTVVATDSYGCTVEDQIVVEVIDALLPTQIVCDDTVLGEITFAWDEVAGANNYEVNINGNGWESPNSSQFEHNVSGLGLGEFVSIEVRTSSDCGDGPVAVLECQSLNCVPAAANANMLTNTSCPDTNDGSVLISTDAVTMPITYLLDGESNNDGVFTNLAAGMYIAEVIDGLNCSAFVEFEIGTPEAIVSNEIIVSPISCSSSTDGAVSFEVSGGAAPYAFSWENTTTDSINTNLTSGTYPVTITDSNNCTHLDTIALMAPNGIIFDSALTEIDCNNATTGSIAAIASGGTGTLSYAWNDGTTDSLLTNIGAGDYMVTISDESNCTETASFTLTNPAPVDFSISSSAASCFNTTDGTATVSPNGDNYTYLWSNDSTSSTITNLIPGDYFVTVSDENACTTSDTVTVMSTPEIVLSPTIIDNACNNSSTGSISIDATGGTGTLEYTWDTGNIGNTIFDLPAGIYVVTVSDSNSCMATDSLTVNQPDVIEISSTIIPVGCNGESSGSIDISTAGGSGEYSYNWDNSATSEDLNNLSVGSYTVLVTDGNNCTAQSTFEVTQSTLIASSFDVESVGCFGESSGSIISSVNGGQLPYSYLWSNGGSEANLFDIAGGQYTLTVTDASNCSSTFDVEVPQPDGIIEGETTQNDISCFNSNDGVITINATGGTSPYLYSINGNDFSTSNTFTGLTPSDYLIFIEDANGCIASLPNSVILEEPEALTIELGDNLTIELGESISLNPIIDNASNTVTYLWSSNDVSTLSCLDCMSPEVNTAQSANYSLLVTDENGCHSSDNINIFINREVEVLVPTGFTPNGDNLNDILTVHGKSDKIEEILLFQVFDRWGELVYERNNFEVNDLSVGWDGNFRGKEMPAGVFVWYIEIQLVGGRSNNFKGETTLIR